MAETGGAKPGSVNWFDLTVPDAAAVRDFYKDVVGWEHSAVDMGDYEDYCMIQPGAGGQVAGVCHARGPNADLPPMWLIYINVEDLDGSLARVTAAGGKLLGEVREAPGYGRYCPIEDPAGAQCVLFQPLPPAEGR